jgi:hypothetical protein
MGATDAPRRKTWVICLGAEAIADSTAYVLVDKSDTANFPHNETNFINVLGLNASVETHGDGIFDTWLGVITEVDATNGTAKWFDALHCENRDNPTDDTGHFDFERDYTRGGAAPDGICCKVNTDESTPYLGSNLTQEGNTNWQTDVGLASIAGAAGGSTGKPGAGDIVMWVEEVTNGGTLDFCITLTYEDH